MAEDLEVVETRGRSIPHLEGQEEARCNQGRHRPEALEAPGHLEDLLHERGCSRGPMRRLQPRCCKGCLEWLLMHLKDLEILEPKAAEAIYTHVMTGRNLMELRGLG